MATLGDPTLYELCVELEGRGVVIHRSSVGRLLHRLGLSHKKTLQASQQERLDMHLLLAVQSPQIHLVHHDALSGPP